MMDIILASKSPRRSELLTMLGVEFTVKTGNSPEAKFTPRLSVTENLRTITASKGLSVADENPDSGVIASDTIVILEGEHFGKPENEAMAKEMLKQLSGKTHEVFTGVALYCKSANFSQFAAIRSRVTFRTLTEGEIDDYIKTGEPLDKAGAYGIQGKGGSLIRRIDGDFYNVMGLPLGTVRALLFNLDAHLANT